MCTYVTRVASGAAIALLMVAVTSMILIGFLPILLEGPVYAVVGLTTGVWTPVFIGDRVDLLFASEVLWGFLLLIAVILFTAHVMLKTTAYVQSDGTPKNVNSFLYLLKRWAQNYDEGKCDEEVRFND